MHTTLVKDWMTPDPVYASPETPLPAANKLLKEHGIRRLPVVDKGKLVGIVTWGDIRAANPSDATSLSVFELNYLLDLVTLAQVMSRDPVTVTPDTPIQEAARLMFEYKVSGLPVLEDQHLVGIITESDIFRLVVKLWEEDGTAAGESILTNRSAWQSARPRPTSPA